MRPSSLELLPNILRVYLCDYEQVRSGVVYGCWSVRIRVGWMAGDDTMI